MNHCWTSDPLVRVKPVTRCRTSWVARIRQVVVVPPLEAVARPTIAITIVVEVGATIAVTRVRTAIAIAVTVVREATTTTTMITIAIVASDPVQRTL